MEPLEEKQEAARLLAGLENGSLAPADAVFVAEQLDPVYLYLIVSYLRAVYPASDPAASAVLERVVLLTTSGPILLRKHKEGQQDPVSRWFESDHSYGEYRGRAAEFVDLIHDKLES